VGNAGDSGGGIRANAGKHPQLLRRSRQVSQIVVSRKLCGFVQHPRPPVVAQPAPQGKHVFFRRQGKGNQRRKSFHERLVALHHHGYAGLLQHDL
jgi:hypothetical protein